MTRGSDDDALSWAGDDDPTLEPGGAAREGAPVSLPAGFTAVGKGSETVAAADAESAKDADLAGSAEPEPEPEPSGFSNAALVGIGVLGGVYLFLTIGWLLGAARLQLIAQLFLDPVAFQVTFWLAVAAPALFFGTVYLLTRRTRTWVRFTILTAGAVLLIPWPFVLGGVVIA